MPIPDSDSPTSGLRLSARQVRDLSGVLLILAGLVGVFVTLWQWWDPLAACLFASVVAVALGLFLGWERS